MTPRAPYMRCQWPRMHIENFEDLREFEFMWKKALAPYSGAQEGFLMKVPVQALSFYEV
jgi:hypothetical protein